MHHPTHTDSDFILVPIKDRQAVVKTLLGKGFVFSDDDQSRLVSANPSPTSTSHRHAFSFSSHGSHSRAPSQDTSDDQHSPGSGGSGGGGGGGPPPSSVDDLQQRTFDLLRKRHVVPYVEPDLTVVQCTGIRGAGISTQPTRGGGGGGHGHGHGGHGSRRGSKPARPPCWVDTVDAKLYTSVVSALVAQPRFLSVTLAHDDPPSLLLDKELLGLFGEALVGPVEGALVPIFLDLADLPFEATGIVSGVAGRLVREVRMTDGAELSYLSTARSGAVILSREQADLALAVLKPLLLGGDRK